MVYAVKSSHVRIKTLAHSWRGGADGAEKNSLKA